MILSLKEYGYKILFTSHIKIKNIESYCLGTLLPFDAQKLFLQYYQTQEIEKVDKIIDYLGLHTLFIKLVAETIENEGYSLDDILAKFENGELSKIEFIDEESGDEVTFNHNLQKLFSMHNLKDEYILLLKQLSILPSIDIELSFLGEILGNERLKGKLNFLVGRGWLIKNEESYKLHQIIKAFILANYTPIFDEIEVILDRYLKYLGNTSIAKMAFYNIKYNIFYDELLKYFHSINNIENQKIVSFFKLVGAMYIHTYDFDRSLKLNLKSLEISKKILKENAIEVAEIYNSLGYIYKYKKNYNKALYFYKESLQIANINNDNSFIIGVYINLGEVYRSLKQYNSSLKVLDKALKMSIDFFGENHLLTATIYNNIGSFYIDINEYEKALVLILKSIKIKKNLKKLIILVSLKVIKIYQ